MNTAAYWIEKKGERTYEPVRCLIASSTDSGATSPQYLFLSTSMSLSFSLNIVVSTSGIFFFHYISRMKCMRFK